MSCKAINTLVAFHGVSACWLWRFLNHETGRQVAAIDSVMGQKNLHHATDYCQ